MEEHAGFNPNVIDCDSIWDLSSKMKWTISNETPINDAHLGYYGNRRYAEYLFEKIKYLQDITPIKMALTKREQKQKNRKRIAKKTRKEQQRAGIFKKKT